MIRPFKHISLRRRISLTFWGLNILLCVTILAFALRSVLL
jgi:hypothetical protein